MGCQANPSKEMNSFTCWLIKGETGKGVSEALSCEGHCGFNKHLKHPAMSVVVHGSASYRTGSIARSNFQTSGYGIGLKSVASSSHSICGDYGTKDFSSSFVPSYEFSVFGNEKLTMQNLNSRLASYLKKVK